jgi:hypothetical protein
MVPGTVEFSANNSTSLWEKTRARIISLNLLSTNADEKRQIQTNSYYLVRT